MLHLLAVSAAVAFHAVLAAEVVARKLMFQADPAFWSLLGGVVVPHLTAVLAKAHAPSWVKVALTAALAAVTGGIATAVAGNGQIEVYGWLTNMGLAWITALATYPTVTEKLGTTKFLREATARFGIGPAPKDDLVLNDAEIREYRDHQRETGAARAGSSGAVAKSSDAEARAFLGTPERPPAFNTDTEVIGHVDDAEVFDAPPPAAPVKAAKAKKAAPKKGTGGTP